MDQNSQYNQILNNSANNNDFYGIAIHHSPYNTIKNNTMSGNLWNFDIEGDTEAELTQYMDDSNTVNGSPIIYRYNESDQLYDLSNPADTIYFVNCFNMTVLNLTFTNQGYPLRFWNTTNSRIENVTSYDNEDGLLMQAGSNNNYVLNSSFNSNHGYGVEMNGSGHNTFETVNASNNVLSGFIILSSEL